ncbi:putative protein N(5)-glutamine methyltransferase [Cellulomonas endophytica]|uniref:putative protein N(5)-glutamine methyltransferase n=1 Tax=Cellulomonas endophytica TaxID=2494735 RepID=UPI001F0C82B8|nr:putative protein N(5)-glutamine methyltransferase [Cellulomonas endophytica]
MARLRAAGCVFAEEEADLLLGEGLAPAALRDAVARRVAGEPLEHVLGSAAFAGLRVPVGAGVFVPRRRTELLVSEARPLLAAGSVLADLCCGSGAVGLALATQVPGVVLHAVDVEPAAVDCARRALAPVGGTVHAGDVLTALPADLVGRVDVVVANAPYVPHDAVPAMPREARLHEPAVALDGGADGTAVQARVARAAARWLRRGGTLLVETSEDGADRTAAVVRAAGLVDAVLVRDDRVDGTVVRARAPLPGAPGGGAP